VDELSGLVARALLARATRDKHKSHTELPFRGKIAYLVDTNMQNILRPDQWTTDIIPVTCGASTCDPPPEKKAKTTC
jgi:hypothetical protein